MGGGRGVVLALPCRLSLAEESGSNGEWCNGEWCNGEWGGGGRGVVLALQNEFTEIFIYSLFEGFC